MSHWSTPICMKIPLTQDNNFFCNENISKTRLLEETSRLEQYVSERRGELDTFPCQTVEEHSPDDTSALWETLGQSPLVFETDESNKIMKLYFDVSKYDPNEVRVLLQENVLLINAVHHDQLDADNYNELNISFPLPSFVESQTLEATVTGEGLLVIEARLIKPALDEMIRQNII